MNRGAGRRTLERSRPPYRRRSRSPCEITVFTGSNSSCPGIGWWAQLIDDSSAPNQSTSRRVAILASPVREREVMARNGRIRFWLDLPGLRFGWRYVSDHEDQPFPWETRLTEEELSFDLPDERCNLSTLVERAA